MRELHKIYLAFYSSDDEYVITNAKTGRSKRYRLVPPVGECSDDNVIYLRATKQTKLEPINIEPIKILHYHFQHPEEQLAEDQLAEKQESINQQELEKEEKETEQMRKEQDDNLKQLEKLSTDLPRARKQNSKRRKLKKKEEEEFEIEKILDHRINNFGYVEYLIQWKDFPINESSWTENISAPLMVSEYHKSINKKEEECLSRYLAYYKEIITQINTNPTFKSFNDIINFLQKEVGTTDLIITSQYMSNSSINDNIATYITHFKELDFKLIIQNNLFYLILYQLFQKIENVEYGKRKEYFTRAGFSDTQYSNYLKYSKVGNLLLKFPILLTCEMKYKNDLLNNFKQVEELLSVNLNPELQFKDDIIIAIQNIKK